MTPILSAKIRSNLATYPTSDIDFEEGIFGIRCFLFKPVESFHEATKNVESFVELENKTILRYTCPPTTHA